jgi:hypothetical protein
MALQYSFFLAEALSWLVMGDVMIFRPIKASLANGSAICAGRRRGLPYSNDAATLPAAHYNCPALAAASKQKVSGCRVRFAD